MPPVETGRRFGPYELVSILGKGGMGIVYLARDAERREVALKVVLDEFGGDPDIQRRFQRESRIALGVVHPNVVRTFDAGTHEGKLFLACEVVRGGSLGGVLERERTLSAARTLAVAVDLLAALTALERAGLIHRDVKPANLLLTQDGTGKLSDFGLARPTDAARTRFTQTGQVAGTPSYMAPEQIDGLKQIDIRCDLYAAGCVLFHCLVGRAPFDGDGVLQILKKHLFEPAPDLRSLVPGVPPQLAALVADLLRKEPGERPPTAAAALARVEAMLRPAAAFPGTIDERAVAAPFPGTIDERAGLVTGALSPPVDAFPRTLDEAGAASFPRTLDERPAVEVISRSGDDAPLSRAALVVGARSLFVYAQHALRLGRDGLERKDQDVCLRLRPAAGNEEQIRRISSQHLSFLVRDDGVSLVDLRSTSGTTLDGRPVAAGAPQPLTAQRHAVTVAGVLDLTASVVAAPRTPLPEVRGVGRAAGLASVVIERPTNGREHAYALVPGRVTLGIAADGSFTFGGEGGVEVFAVGTGLWLRGPAGSCRPLVAGLAFQVGSVEVQVRELRPADQK